MNKSTPAPIPLKWTPELVKKFWSLVSQTPIANISFSHLLCAELTAFIQQHVPLSSRVIDFGAGDGDLSESLLAAGYYVAAYEPSPGRRKAILDKPMTKHPNFLGVLSEPDGTTFDAVLAFEVLEHLLPETVDQDMKTLTELLGPTGQLIGTVPLNECLENNECICPVCSHLFHRWQHMRSFSKSSLVDFFAHYGIHQVHHCSVAEFSVSLVFIASKSQTNEPLDITLTLPAPSLEFELMSVRQQLSEKKKNYALLKQNSETLKSHLDFLNSVIGFLDKKQQQRFGKHPRMTRWFARWLRLMDEPSLVFKIPQFIAERIPSLIHEALQMLYRFSVHCFFLCCGLGRHSPHLLKKKEPLTQPQKSFCIFSNRYSLKQKNNRISVCFFKNGLAWGGAERQLVLTAKELKKRGCEVRVVLLNNRGDDSHYLPMLHESGIPVSVISSHFFKMILNLLRLKRAGIDISQLIHVPIGMKYEVIGLARELIRQCPDVLHCYLDSNNIIGAWAGLIVGVSHIRLSGRNVNPSHFPWFYSGNYKDFYKEILQLPKVKLEVNSQYGMSDYASWLKIPESDIDVIHNGINTKIWGKLAHFQKERIRAKLGLKSDDVVILSVFRFSAEKRPQDFVCMAGELKKRGIPVKFVHAGSRHVLNKETMKLAHDLHVTDHITFLGVREDIPELMAMADIFLCVSEKEGLPNVIMEAMASELPVVSTAVGGIEELIHHGKHGFIHPLGHYSEIADSLSMLASHPELRRQMGAAGRQRIEESFSVEKLGERLIQSYTEALHKES